MVDYQERDTRRGRTASPDDGSGESTDHTTNAGHHSKHGGDESTAESHDHHDHHHAHDLDRLGAAVVTISSTRTLEDDPSGDILQDRLEEEGHEVVTRELVGDSADRIQQIVDNLVDRRDVDIVVTTGGTGVTPDDTTIEAVRPLFEKQLPGFGELFRRRSEDEIGTRVIATRTTGGLIDTVPVFCLPGSANAARLGVDLILPEAGHLAGLAQRDNEEE